VKTLGDRVILHSDINACYANIELLHHLELRGKPVAVGGEPEAERIDAWRYCSFGSK